MRNHLTPFLLLLFGAFFLSDALQAQSSQIDSTVCSVKRLYIQGKRFTAVIIGNGCYVLKGRDTVIKHPGDDFFSIVVKDFNKDGYADLLMEESSNTPAKYVLLLYVPGSGTFREVANFDLFPAPTKIHNKKVYYSYHKNGCADMDWVSDLFYLDHFRAILIGKIHGSTCEADLERSLHIYKVKASRRILLKELPISTVDGYKGNKFEFIKKYWNKNYKRFL